MRLVGLETTFVNRSAIVVRPKKPYLDWASSTDQDAGEQAALLTRSRPWAEDGALEAYKPAG